MKNTVVCMFAAPINQPPVQKQPFTVCALQSGREGLLFFPLNLIGIRITPTKSVSTSENLFLCCYCFASYSCKPVLFIIIIIVSSRCPLPSTNRFTPRFTQVGPFHHISVFLSIQTYKQDVTFNPYFFFPHIFQGCNLTIYSSQKTDTTQGKTPRQIRPDGMASPYKEKKTLILICF